MLRPTGTVRERWAHSSPALRASHGVFLASVRLPGRRKVKAGRTTASHRQGRLPALRLRMFRLPCGREFLSQHRPGSPGVGSSSPSSSSRAEASALFFLEMTAAAPAHLFRPHRGRPCPGLRPSARGTPSAFQLPRPAWCLTPQVP